MVNNKADLKQRQTDRQYKTDKTDKYRNILHQRKEVNGVTHPHNHFSDHNMNNEIVSFCLMACKIHCLIVEIREGGMQSLGYVMRECECVLSDHQ